MKSMIFVFGILMFALPAMGEFGGKVHEYQSSGQVFEGYMAIPENIKEKAPAVLIVHDWKGVSDFYRDVADKIASMGYVAFALDVYGKGIRPSSVEEASAEAGKYKSNRNLFRERVKVGLNELLKAPKVDATRVAAIGYCFGGTGVLELARSGAPVNGVVSFHGGLDSPTAEDARNIKSKVLVLHGADDPFVPPKEVDAFQNEMRGGKVDWQLVSYGNAVHSFTNPAAGSDNSKGSAYNKLADKRSWSAMKTFFDELFTSKP